MKLQKAQEGFPLGEVIPQQPAINSRGTSSPPWNKLHSKGNVRQNTHRKQDFFKPSSLEGKNSQILKTRKLNICI